MVAVLLVAVVAFVLRPGWRWEVVFQLVLALVEIATRRGERRRIRVAVQRKLSRRARDSVLLLPCAREDLRSGAPQALLAVTLA